MLYRRTLGALTWPSLVGVLLLGISLLAYGPALDGEMIWDDDAHVTAPALRSLDGLWRIWTDSRATQQYYPLVHSAFWLQYQLWGLATVGYHLVNVVLHVASALLLWQILVRLRVPGALLAAAVWALHPVNVESVAWISELKNTLSGMLYFAALLAYLGFDPPGTAARAGGAEDADDRNWTCYHLAFALFVAALLSKTVTASLPAALALIFWWKDGRLDWARRGAPLVPFFTVGAALGLTTAWVERYLLGAEGPAFELTWLDRVLVAGRAVWFYLGKIAWPSDMSFVYPRWTVDPSDWTQWAYPAGVVAAGGALWALQGRIGRAPLAAALYFVGTLFPALGFFNVYTFNYSFVADHFQYLASVGPIAAAAAVIVAVFARLGLWTTATGAAACAALVVVLAGLSWQQAHLYGNLETLYRDIMTKDSRGLLAHLNLGVVYLKQGRHDEAITVYQNLIRIKPDYTRAYSNLGAVYATLGRHADAAAVYERALAIDPQFAEARYHLALAREAEGRLDEALVAYEGAVAGLPDSAPAALGLGRAYVGTGRHAEAVEVLKRAVAREPQLAEAHYVLGLAYGALGRSAEAIDAYKAAVAVMPTYAEAYNNLGIEYRKQGQLAEAVSAYRRAVTLNRGFAAAYNNLGAAYAAQTRYAEAVQAWQEAVRYQPDGPVGQAARRNLEIVRPLVGPVKARSEP